MLAKRAHTSAAAIGWAILLGTAIGSAITLLLAPSAGSDSRKWVSKSVRRMLGLQQDGTQKTKPYTVNYNKYRNRATMHAGDTTPEDGQLSKSLSMINHLKHTRKGDKNGSEPQ